ncbi:hypothetical protein KIP69_12155 [Geobacter sulfurreducens]|jgi:hypothetical protein|uniref:hypothetical protein n=1 Tax=Geobacter sulfurreducens TaxID=35554 RepID=UPI0001E3429C|nr:hypothetical protein [Geobacter sulfurreducens]ADI85270.2 hypothetical protein KN400_2458 [Geobacter sulfurreducens KN400]AJY68746.1 hypothetical protein RW64_03595 [Geobacter sulfurreducens]QVW34340.1 hypothetical protein KIP69_12155 [Geobacter sulfurreducens]
MRQSIAHTLTGTAARITLAVMIAVVLGFGPDAALAKRGGRDDNRTEFYGIVQERPEQGLHGTWVIGGRTFTTDSRTEFDQSEGRLEVGSCAKVHIRSGRVHEIDSEPMSDCR